MTCKPCRVTFLGNRYHIDGAGNVRVAVIEGETPANIEHNGSLAKAVRAEAARQRRNRNARERHQAMTDLGMRRTPYRYE